ncbi:MAG: hypothetical protein QM535_05130 [Limnohabitans sp.]|nr:hypothetical protein [Limnohabitans sp.]
MNEEIYTVFESYLQNELSNEDKISLENQLKNDGDLSEKFKIYRENSDFLNQKFSEESINFKQNLQKISNEHFSQANQTTKVIRFQPWKYAIAASITLFFGIWFLMQNDMPEYSDFSQHEVASFVERGTNDANLKAAQDAFNLKNYKEAVIELEAILKKENNVEIKYFYAISLLEQNQFVNAEEYFNELKNGNSVYKEKAVWYLALSQLKQKNKEECIKYLKQIPEGSEDYDNAQKLLNDL